ncbi:MAG: hypothetical protein EPN21_09755 [Methylococcaceae bacterium]|nr:MAG: hypothetical protein EPN21_09755 [Methylococcaceae bacterium]
MQPIATLFLCVLLSACSVLPSRPAPPAVHDFGPAAAANAAAVNVDAPSWLRDERLRYRLLYNDPTQVRFYARDHWLAPPPALLGQRLNVAVDGDRYRLKVTLTDFEQMFDAPDQARVVLNLRVHAETVAGKPVAERLFQYTQPCSSADARGAVEAYAALVRLATDSLRTWLLEMP